MTNEQFLYITYFGSAAGGIALAVITAVILARPHRQATESQFLPKLGKFLRCVFPPWLIIAVLLGFMSVSYTECRSYAEIVGDRDYMVDKTQEIVYRMAFCLAIAVLAYALVLILFLLARARAQRYRSNMQN